MGFLDALLGGPSISPAEAAEALRRREAVALDVREPHEWRAGRIAGSLHVPLGALAARVDRLDRDTRVITVCRTGSRSGRAAAALRRAGFQVENLSGGLHAWERAGLPLEPRGGRVL